MVFKISVRVLFLLGLVSFAFIVIKEKIVLNQANKAYDAPGGGRVNFNWTLYKPLMDHYSLIPDWSADTYNRLLKKYYVHRRNQFLPFFIFCTVLSSILFYFEKKIYIYDKVFKWFYLGMKKGKILKTISDLILSGDIFKEDNILKTKLEITGSDEIIIDVIPIFATNDILTKIILRKNEKINKDLFNKIIKMFSLKYNIKDNINNASIEKSKLRIKFMKIIVDENYIVIKNKYLSIEIKNIDKFEILYSAADRAIAERLKILNRKKLNQI